MMKSAWNLLRIGPAREFNRCELLTAVRNKGAEHALLDPPKASQQPAHFCRQSMRASPHSLSQTNPCIEALTLVTAASLHSLTPRPTKREADQGAISIGVNGPPWLPLLALWSGGWLPFMFEPLKRTRVALDACLVGFGTSWICSAASSSPSVVFVGMASLTVQQQWLV